MPLYTRFVLLLLWLTPFAIKAQERISTAGELLPKIRIDTVQPSPVFIDSVSLPPSLKYVLEVRQVLDSGLIMLDQAIDSLGSIATTPRKFQDAIACIYARFDSSFVAPLKSRADTLGTEVKDRISHLEDRLNAKRQFMDSLLAANQFTSLEELSSKVKLSNADLKWPEFPTAADFVRVNEIGNLSASLPAVPSARLDVPDIRSLPNPLSDIGDLAADVKGYKDQVMDFSEARINPDELMARFEKQLSSASEVNLWRNSSQAMTTAQQQMERLTATLSDQDKLKEELKTGAGKEFVDHFAGHEDKIKAEIKSMEKLQRKYHSVADVRYLPKRRTNPEKGKPFVERLIAGTLVQIDHGGSEWTQADVSPYVGYKFSDRFRLSVGGTYRITFDVKTLEFTGDNKAYGFRLFSNYRIISRWSGHLEAEVLKARARNGYSTPVVLSNAGRRWMFTTYAGIVKTFGINKHLDGNTQVLYDVLKVGDIFNVDHLAFRCGLEYKFMARKK